MMGPQYPDGHLPYPNANMDSHRGGLTQVGMHTRYGVGHIISGSKHLDSDHARVFMLCPGQFYDPVTGSSM